MLDKNKMHYYNSFLKVKESALQMYVFFDTILFILTNPNKCKLLIFSMKFLNKLADADVLACGCNLLKGR